MKVCVIAPSVYTVPPGEAGTNPYGGEVAVWDLCYALGMLGVEVHLFAIPGSRAPPNGYLHYTPRSGWTDYWLVEQYPLQISAYKRILDEADVIHCYTHTQVVADHYLWRGVMKAVSTCWANCPTRPLAKRMLSCWSHFQRRNALNMGFPETTRVVYGACDTEFFSPDPNRPYEKENFHLFLARMHPTKRPELYLSLAERLPDERFILAGSFSASPDHAYYGSLLMKRAERLRNVTVEPDVTEERKLWLFRHAKSFIFPSIQEAFGLTLVQSLACGCPVICSREGCYSEDTLILTPSGPKHFNMLKKGELVWSLNPVTEELEAKPIAKIFSYNYDGELIKIKSRSVDLMVTPNHNMLIRTLYCKKPWRFEKAERCMKRHNFLLPIKARWRGKNQNKISLAEIGVENVKVYKNGNKLPRQLNTDTFLELCGWYISDGSISKARGDCITETAIQISEPRNGRYRKEVCELVSKLGLKPCLSENYIQLYSAELASFFKTCGHSAKTKKIPSWLLEFSPKHLIHLFNGLMKGDGTRRSTNKRFMSYSTVSLQLAYDVVQLCLKLGIRAKVRKRTKTSVLEGRLLQSTEYVVQFSYRPYTQVISNTHLSRVPYNGLVWCALVEDNHNLLVGKSNFVFCGNSFEELVREGETGFLAQTLEEYERAVRNVDAIDPRRCREDAVTRFSRERLGREYLQIYERVAGGEAF
jgi:glycosyltransferase involved in cell wall biosynthesis